MALDPQKRQKKTERRQAKQRAKRKELAARSRDQSTARFHRAAAGPIEHCCMTESLWDQGIGYVLISRSLGVGEVAFTAFLVDVYCLGVKDVMFDIESGGRYRAQIYDGLMRKHGFVELSPPCARNLVEGAVSYASELGLPPHPDYSEAKAIFGDLDTGACSESFRYGKEGKPFFVAGPRDGPARCARIIGTLENRCGPGGFDYFVPFDL